MKVFLPLLFVTFSLTFSFAQTNPPSVELLANEKFTPDSIYILNIEDMEDSVELIMEVVTTGAIQKRMGKMMSGGNEAQKLRGTFVYVINQDNEIINKEFKWLEARGTPNQFNYLTIPLTDAQSHMDSKVFATEKDAADNIEYLKFQQMKINNWTEEDIQHLIDSAFHSLGERFKEDIKGLFEPVAVLGGMLSKKEFTGDDLPETIYSVVPVISLFSGKLNKLRSGTFTKQADGERSLLTGRYERKDYETYDIEMEDIFDNENKRLTSLHHVIPDPLTGNVIIYAGVKVRKDDDRENNKYYEHLILTLDRKGKILNKVTLKNENPWEVGTSRLIGEEKFSQFADPKFDKIYISQHQPAKDFNEGADLSIHRMLLIDKNGEVEYKAQFECVPGYQFSLQRAVAIGDNILANYYKAWPDQHFAGIYSFNKEKGLADNIFLKWGETDKLIPTEENKDIMNIMNYVADDSSRILIDLFYHKEEKGTTENPGLPARYYNYYMYKISPDGSLSDVVVFDRKSDNYTDLMELEALADNEDEFIFKLEEFHEGRNFVRIKSIDKSDLSTREFSPPYPLLGDNAFYLDEKSNRMYFVVQDDEDRILLIQQ